jgi:rhomboid protease GluP
MPARVCSFCGHLNANDEARCVRCGRRLLPAWQHSVVQRGVTLARRPYVATYFFLTLSVGVYLLLVLQSGGLFAAVRPYPALRWGALVGRFGEREPWRFLSAMFVHFNLLHIGFNALALHSLGRNLEEAAGPSRFTLIFLGTGIGGFVASELWYAPQPLTGGISGGIFGLLGAAVGWNYAQRNEQWKRLAITGAGYAVAMALIPGQTVNNAAHVGGLVLGAVLGWAFQRIGWRQGTQRVTAVAAALLVIATVASIVLSLLSPLPRRLVSVGELPAPATASV